jgi:hypothetical protein
MLPKVKMLILGITAALLVGCSSMGSYYQAVDSTNARYVEVTLAQAKAEEARYNALARIAESGDPTAKVAATMALALGGKQEAPKLNTPAVPQNEALQWASILVPGIAQGMSIYYNTQATMNANNNATALGMNTNSTFATFASEINSPVVVTQPAPIVVEQPAPVVVNPVVVEPQVITVPQ